MKIEKIYIGGWFQRTTLHLSEIYDFLREGESVLKLDKKKLKNLHTALGIKSAELKINGLEYILLELENNLLIKIFEDGLIVLETNHKEGEETSTEIKILTDYYEKKLSPAFNYLFSLGAPVPKELANIKNVYPYFVLIKDAHKNEITKLLSEFKQEKYFEVMHDNFELYRGDKFYIINNKSEGIESIDRFVEEQVFLREFKTQLHHYLNLHRTIWEKIADVKEKGEVKGGEIGSLRDKVEGYGKTINLIEARIKQMNAYLRTRERIAKTDETLKSFQDVIEYRYETLADTLLYIDNIWSMTKNYVNASLSLFSSLQTQVTANNVKNLTVVTSMGVGATLIGLFTTSSIPKFTTFGLLYFLILALIGYVADGLTKHFYRRKIYKISDIDYDKHITN